MLVMLQPDAAPPQEAPPPQPPVPPLSLADQVHVALRAEIMRLDLAPGQMLRKPELCARFGVSRSPVNEAIMRLQSEGLVVVQPQAGSFVARFSMAEIREGAFLREALEMAAVDIVARIVTPAQLATLQALIAAQEEAVAAGDGKAFHRADAAMHEAILSATGHRRLAALSRTSWVHVDRARQLILPHPGRMVETVQEHRAILGALAAHDAPAARAATQAHLRQLLTFLEPLAQTRPDLFDPP
jgi:DNA-binding GntR family transcriptional regulator